MTGMGGGLDGRRVYLDWNATAPLRPEARAAMLEAMDTLGNPSSVHAEGRAAKGIVETARHDVANLVECHPDEVVFTAGATEAANLFLFGNRWGGIALSAAEHDCVWNAAERANCHLLEVPLTSKGCMGLADRGNGFVVLDPRARATDTLSDLLWGDDRVMCHFGASGETGVIDRDLNRYFAGIYGDIAVHADVTQLLGRGSFHGSEIERPPSGIALSCSAHKLGGPKGVGALCLLDCSASDALIVGGGQEQGRRSGTENVIGIAGFGAAAVAAKRDLEAGLWDQVEKLRDILEDGLEAAAPDLIIFGRDAPRLPNTSCFAVPGWKGETQVMQLDLAGFAVSAGSACSSGKVKESRVLRAMGFDILTASSAIRVSLGPTTTEAEIRAFLTAWTTLYRKRATRAA